MIGLTPREESFCLLYVRRLILLDLQLKKYTIAFLVRGQGAGSRGEKESILYGKLDNLFSESPLCVNC